MRQFLQDQKDRKKALMRATAKMHRGLIADLVEPGTMRLRTVEELAATELIALRAERIEKQAEQQAAAAYAAAAARGVLNAGVPAYVAPMAGAAAPDAPVANSAPQTAPAKRLTAFSVSFDYMVATFKAGQYSNAKEFFRALEQKAGAGSPFEKGTGSSAGSLFVRELHKPLALKTLENKLPEIREAAKSG